ncbi:MAG: antibiotic biosynthesis monooxygenase [Spirochaetota bacterium]|nr:antibiotic biosynthesis monooxygenase [Spirochaetota bacterium]
MIVTIVNVHVKPEHVDDFIKTTIENHKNSIKESGNLRFDALQCNDDPTKFILYEAYISSEAAAEHKNTSHYAVWKDTVAPWMAQPRQGTTYTIIAPNEVTLWK